MIVIEHLFRDDQNLDPGEISGWRSVIVSNEVLGKANKRFIAFVSFTCTQQILIFYLVLNLIRTCCI